MKYEKILIRAGIVLITLACAGYCLYFAAQSFFQAKSGSEFSSKFKYGIVQTTKDKNLSYITYYDSNLAKVYTQKLKYGSIGNTVQFPQVYSPKTYLVPQGIPGKKDLTKVVSVNMETGKVKSYDMKQTNITNYKVDKKDIYSAAEKDGEVILTKCVKETKELSTQSLGEVTLDSLQLFDGKLYAFTSKGKTSSVVILDTKTLQVLMTVDLSKIPGTKTAALLSSDTMFFTCTNQNGTSCIGKLNLLTKEAESIPISLTEASQIFKYADKLIVTQNGSNKVCVYDTTKQKETIHKLEGNAIQYSLSGQTLYCLDDEHFSLYNIKDFSLQKKIQLKAKKSSTASYEFTGFFLKP